MKFIQWTEEDKSLIEEISTLYGINKQVVEEVFEYLFLSSLEKILKSEIGTPIKIHIPCIGELYIRADLEGQNEISLNFFSSLTESFKGLILNRFNDPQKVRDTIDSIVVEKIKNLLYEKITK